MILVILVSPIKPNSTGYGQLSDYQPAMINQLLTGYQAIRQLVDNIKSVVTINQLFRSDESAVIDQLLR